MTNNLVDIFRETQASTHALSEQLKLVAERFFDFIRLSNPAGWASYTIRNWDDNAYNPLNPTSGYITPFSDYELDMIGSGSDFVRYAFSDHEDLLYFEIPTAYLEDPEAWEAATLSAISEATDLVRTELINLAGEKDANNLYLLTEIFDAHEVQRYPGLSETILVRYRVINYIDTYWLRDATSRLTATHYYNKVSGGLYAGNISTDLVQNGYSEEWEQFRMLDTAHRRSFIERY